MPAYFKMTWDRELETGIREVDRQHQGIVDSINTLVEAQGTGDNLRVKKVIQGLTDYTLSHFQFEEELMTRAGYPSIVGHKRIHALFVKKVQEFNERVQNGDDVSGEVIVTLQRWLVTHIKTEDRDYVSAILEKMPELAGDSSEGSWLTRTRKRFFG